jgi:hypothetical protein
MDNINLEYYEEMIHAEDAIQFEGLDYAIIGVSIDGYYVYEYDTMASILIDDDGMTMDEAYEWLDYNVLNINGGKGFVVIHSLEV